MGLINIRKYATKKNELIKIIIKYLIFDTNNLAISHFRKTLIDMNVYDHLKSNFNLWVHIFCKKNEIIANDIINMLSYETSPNGSNYKQMEKNCVFYLTKFIRNCESK